MIVSIGSDSPEGCFPSDLLVLVIPCLNNRFSSTPCIFRCIGLEKFWEVIQLLRVHWCTGKFWKVTRLASLRIMSLGYLDGYILESDSGSTRGSKFIV